jgi:hypothetical protein
MRTWMFVIASILFGALAAPNDAGAEEVSLGVNAPMGSLTVEQQNTNLSNLHARIAPRAVGRPTNYALLAGLHAPWKPAGARSGNGIV